MEVIPNFSSSVAETPVGVVGVAEVVAGEVAATPYAKVDSIRQKISHC